MERPAIPGFLRVILILCGVTGLAQAREVTIQEGPLYRVLDNSASILCNVSGYEGPPTQNFEWFMYRPGAPDISIAIASTKDPDFAYAVFSSRVRQGDIFIRRVSGESAELHIQRLRPEDEGVYECYTPTTDTRYLGTYSAKVALKVIPDTLQVSNKMATKGRLSSSSPLQLTLIEGRELHLSCSASTDSAQHTHLSVTFEVSDPGAPVGGGTFRSILSIGRDFTVEPANQTYSQRYLDGEIRAEKPENATYKMVISRLRPQDTGSYHCTAAQWILDPDRSWQKITEKRSVLAQVTVPSIDSQLKLWVWPQEVQVQSGGMVEVLCNASLALAPPPGMVLSVDWWVSSEEERPGGDLVASMSVDGVVSLGERYVGTDVGRRLVSLEKLSASPASFRLRIHSAQPGDIGSYQCRVQAFLPAGSRRDQVCSRTSRGIRVLMAVQDISVHAVTSLRSATLYRGDTAILLCNVTVETPQTVHLALSWWVELAADAANERRGRLLSAVDRQGVTEAGMRHSGYDVSADKMAAQCYRLRLYNVQAEDEGMYHCAVTAWVQYPDHTWYNAASAKSNHIKVYPYAHAKDLLLIPMIGGVASALFVGVTILSTVTCCYIRHLRLRKR